jgi:SAM-dependent methyltransferase
VSVHSGALGFDGAAEAYERGRPTYPAEAVEAILDALAVDSTSTVLDLAAGTGKLTALIAPRAGRVIAIEPLEGMWRQLLVRVPDVDLLAGTAEAIPLRDASVDAATVAQAFHWFQAEVALAELHRVLCPGAGLGLVWNQRDDRVDWVAELNRIVEPEERDTPDFAAHLWDEPVTLFTPLDVQHFDHVHPLDADGLVDRVRSVSYVAALPPARQDDLVERTRRLVAGFSEPFGLPYRARVLTCTRR